MYTLYYKISEMLDDFFFFNCEQGLLISTFGIEYKIGIRTNDLNPWMNFYLFLEHGKDLNKT